MKYLMSVFVKIFLPLLGYEISNVGICKTNVGIFKDRFTIIGLWNI